MKLFFLTGPEFPAGHPDDQRLFTAARAFAEAAWFDWRCGAGGTIGPGDLVLIRTPWDYQTDPGLFLKVLAGFEAAGARLANPLATVTWNLDKIYLTELAAAGVDVVPTHSFAAFAAANSPAAPSEGLAEFRARWGNGEWILKPRIGASASGIRKLDDAGLDRALAEAPGFAGPSVPSGAAAGGIIGPSAGAGAAVPGTDGPPRPPPLRDLLLQPLIPSVRERGEVSLIYYRIGGEAVFSHASLKRPRAGDFRVQTDWGGTDGPYAPTDALVRTGRRWLELLPQAWVYARVDVLEYEGPRPLLGEVELIEPQLFHRFGARSEELLLRALGLSN